MLAFLFFFLAKTYMFVEGLHLLASFLRGLQNELNNYNSVDAYSEHNLSNFVQSADFRVSFSLLEKNTVQ